MAKRYQVVPASYVFPRRGPDGEEVLLQLRQGTGYRDGHWAAAAAGHVEAGESMLAAACREAREELGIGIDPAALTPLSVLHRTQGNGHWYDERVDFFFECRDWHGTPRIAEPHKVADLAWFPLDALPDPVVPHELLVLDALRTGTPPPMAAVGFPT